MSDDLQKAVDRIIEKAAEDFSLWCKRSPAFEGDAPDEDFANSFSYTAGKKYLKIVRGNSVWGFVVLADGGKFQRGDLLKPASWNAPAKNQARGNVFDPECVVNWTGPLYL